MPRQHKEMEISMKNSLKSEFTRRQQMIREDFELYYYSDTYLEPVQPHSHSCYEIYFFLEGKVRMQAGDEGTELLSGDFLVIPPDTVHFPRFGGWEKPYRRVILWVSQSFWEELQEKSSCFGGLKERAGKGLFRFSCDPLEAGRVQNRLFELIEEVHSGHYGTEVEQRLLLERLLLYLNRLLYEREHPEENGEQSVFEKICGYVETHLDGELTLDRIAGEFYLSKYHIAHLFKENGGLSLHQYILKKRLEACRFLLAGETPISQVYVLCGFRDYSSFFRAFRKEYGMSPKEYRRQIKGEQYDRKQ